MNSLRHMTFNELSHVIVGQPSLRKALVSYALGVVAASRAVLPTDHAPTPRDYYLNTPECEPRVLEIIDSFNEQIVIDLTLSQEVAAAYWLARFAALHPLYKPVLKMPIGDCFELRFLDFTMNLCETTRNLSLNNAPEIGELVNHIHTIID